MPISLRIIARIIARIKDTQKLKQKSHANNCEISLGAPQIILSLIPNFSINKIIKAAISEAVTTIKNMVIQYNVGIIL